MHMNSTWKQHDSFKDSGAYAAALIATAIGVAALVSTAIAQPSQGVAVARLDPIIVTASPIETVQLETIVVTAPRGDEQVAAVPVPCTTAC
jgi:hypothetical protein